MSVEWPKKPDINQHNDDFENGFESGQRVMHDAFMKVIEAQEYGYCICPIDMPCECGFEHRLDKSKHCPSCNQLCKNNNCECYCHDSQPELIPLDKSDLMDFMVRWDKSEYPNDYIKDPEQSEFNMRKANKDIVKAICDKFGIPPYREEVTVEEWQELVHKHGNQNAHYSNKIAKAIFDRIGGKK